MIWIKGFAASLMKRSSSNLFSTKELLFKVAFITKGISISFATNYNLKINKSYCQFKGVWRFNDLAYIIKIRIC